MLVFHHLSKTICSAGNHICPTEESRCKANFVVNYICRDRSRRGASLQIALSIVTLNEESYICNLCFWLDRSLMILFQAKMELKLIWTFWWENGNYCGAHRLVRMLTQLDSHTTYLRIFRILKVFSLYLGLD